MKKNLLIICCSASIYLNAQQYSGNVGVNTAQPAATLEVAGAPTTASKLDGIIAPRLTGAQLRAKSYTQMQTGAQVYVTAPDPTPSGQTVDVTATGYYFFDGTKWVPFIAKTAEPWYNLATNTFATSNTQNIYQTGKVSVGRNWSNGTLSVYDTVGGSNTSILYLNYKNTTFNTNPWISFYGNLGNGSFSTLSNANDMAWVFSVDNNASVYTNNGLLITPHLGGGGATAYGLKITEQGMVSVNTKNPSENFDVTGTVRFRNLPINESPNSIYTNASGASSLDASITAVPISPTQTFTATRTVVADKNGVLGYVNGLPNVTNSRYISSTNTVTILPTDGTLLIDRPSGSTINVNLPPAIDNKNRILTVCSVNSVSDAQIIINNLYTIQSPGGSVVVSATGENKCLKLQSGPTSESNSDYGWYILGRL